MKYTVNIASTATPGEIEQTENFGDLVDLGKFLNEYIADEYQENPGCSTIRELAFVYGILNAGIAAGGNFSFVFQGERFNVECVYDSLAELLAVWREVEWYNARQEPEGPNDKDPARCSYPPLHGVRG